RWGPLVALGVQLRAANDPSRVTPYQLPVAPVAVASRSGAVAYWDPHSGRLQDVMPGHHVVSTGWVDAKPSVEAIP
ncbi:MAG: hypothetical protein ACLP4W_08750, partial [Mycobacterium sp.]|uniref:hypothetical protein n=1 Tax=Mycobacterium sp. TaxID=1785 RepID=UPI003F9DEFE1